MTCESCGMPIESGRYCAQCTDSSGALQPFDERFARMVAWQARRSPGASQEEIERKTLDYMATMPAWRSHPRVTGQLAGDGERQAGSWSSGGDVRHNVRKRRVARGVG